MFFAHITDQRLIEIIAGHLDGRTHYRTAQGNNGDIGGTSADIYDHVSAGLGDIDACADGSRNRLFDNRYFSGARLIRSILYRLLLNLCGSAWNADADSRLSQCFLAYCLVDEIF